MLWPEKISSSAGKRASIFSLYALLPVLIEHTREDFLQMQRLFALLPTWQEESGCLLRHKKLSTFESGPGCAVSRSVAGAFCLPGAGFAIRDSLTFAYKLSNNERDALILLSSSIPLLYERLLADQRNKAGQ